MTTGPVASRSAGVPQQFDTRSCPVSRTSRRHLRRPEIVAAQFERKGDSPLERLAMAPATLLDRAVRAGHAATRESRRSFQAVVQGQARDRQGSPSGAAENPAVRNEAARRMTVAPVQERAEPPDPGVRRRRRREVVERTHRAARERAMPCARQTLGDRARATEAGDRLAETWRSPGRGGGDLAGGASPSSPEHAVAGVAGPRRRQDESTGNARPEPARRSGIPRRGVRQTRLRGRIR